MQTEGYDIILNPVNIFRICCDITLKVSIIIPVFNGAEHIPNFFDALSEQTYGSCEVIFVVDKKTTDDSLKLIEAGRERFPGIKAMIQEGDTKLGGARNEGLAVSDGEIVWFLDVDDKPVPDLLEYTVSVMEKNDADIVMFNSVRSYSRDISIPNGNYEVEVMDREKAVLGLLNLRLPVTAWSKIIRKSLLTENNIEFTHGYAEDVDHTYRAVDRSRTVCFCERPLYIYVQNRSSICNSGLHNNTRGKAEIATYARLEDLFAGDAELNGQFKKRSAIIRIRSSVHMDKENFMKYAKGPECGEMLKSNLPRSVSPEVILFRVAPSLYYSFVSYYLRKIYYKDKKYFRKPKHA